MSSGPETSETEVEDFSARRGAGVMVAVIAVAISTLLVTVISSRSLSETDNEEFLAFWSLLNCVLATLGGLRNETARSVSATMVGGATIGVADGVTPAKSRGVPAMAAPLIWGIGAMVFWCALTPVWSHFLLPHSATVVILIAGVSCLASALQVGFAGVQAGVGNWQHYSGVIFAEAAGRVALMLVVGLTVSTLESLEIAVLAASAAWVLYALVFRRSRSVLLVPGDVGLGSALQKSGLAVLSAGAYGVLVSGLPAMLRMAVGETGDADIMATLMLSIMVARAPILMPLSSLQSVFVTQFVTRPARRRALLLGGSGVIAAGGAVVAGAVALVGAPLMALVFGEEYRPSGLLLGSLVLASVPMAVLMLTSSAVLAMGWHRLYAIGWVLAAVVAVGLLFLPFEPSARVLWAMTVGPLVGVVAYLDVLRKTAASHRADS